MYIVKKEEMKMTKEKKIMREIKEINGIVIFLNRVQAYDHWLDSQLLYAYMYRTYGTPWHRVNYYIHKCIDKALLEKFRY